MARIISNSEKIYLGGVCGMGMAPLAAFLADGGDDIAGFDDNPDEIVRRKLVNAGLKFRTPENGEIFDEFVISTALKRRLAELGQRIHAKSVMRRGEKWAKICAPRRLTAVVGSHGKSTVSSMLAHAVDKLDLDAGWLVGAIPIGFPMHKFCGEGKILISEIDESDATIENFSPEVCVALNADLDHTDTYADDGKLAEMFARLFARTKRAIVYNANDDVLAKLAAESGKELFPVEVGADFIETNKRFALAALEASFSETFADCAPLEGYKGLLRRQETLLATPSIYAVADYAHHPNEVRAFLKWFSDRCGEDDENIVYFQPHRYTRTRRFAKAFAEILEGAAARKHTRIYLLPVYAASEPFDPLGENSAIAGLGADIVPARTEDFEKVVGKYLSGDVPSGDGYAQRHANIAIVGAGDFYFHAKKFLKNNYEK